MFQSHWWFIRIIKNGFCLKICYNWQDCWSCSHSFCVCCVCWPTEEMINNCLVLDKSISFYGRKISWRLIVTEWCNLYSNGCVSSYTANSVSGTYKQHCSARVALTTLSLVMPITITTNTTITTMKFVMNIAIYTQ